MSGPALLVFACLSAGLVAGSGGCRLASRGFGVTLVYPDDGGEAGPNVIVRVGFSQAPNENVCRDAIRLVAVGDGEVVQWDESFAFAPAEDADAKPNTWTLSPEEPLALGVEYAVVVPNGEGGCVSATGDDVTPFVSYFTVQEGG